MYESGRRLPGLDPGLNPQEAILDHLPLGDLEQLQGILGQPWQDIILHERTRHEKVIHNIWQVPPTPQSAPYPKGLSAATYVDTIRVRSNAVNTNPQYATHFHKEAQALGELSYPILKTKLGYQSKYLNQGLTDFAKANLSAVLLAPRVMALQTYSTERNDTIKIYLPTEMVKGKTQVGISIDRHKATGAQLDYVLKVIGEIPYRTPLPDFFQLPEARRTAILEHVTDEVTQFVKLAESYGLDNLVNGKSVPLGILSAKDFHNTLAEQPEMPALELCSLFFREPHNFKKQAAFHAAVTRARYQHIADVRAAVEQAKSDITPAEVPDVSVPEAQSAIPEDLDPNEQEIYRLVNDPDVTEAVLDLRPGETVAITDEVSLYSQAQLDEVLDKHLELIGRAIYESIDSQNPKGVILYDWNRTSIGGLLRGKGFHGNVRNIHVTRLLATVEELQTQFGDNYDPI